MSTDLQCLIVLDGYWQLLSTHWERCVFPATVSAIFQMPNLCLAMYQFLLDKPWQYIVLLSTGIILPIQPKNIFFIWTVHLTGIPFFYWFVFSCPFLLLLFSYHSFRLLSAKYWWEWMGFGWWRANASLIRPLLQSCALLWVPDGGERCKAVDPRFICHKPIHQSSTGMSACWMTCGSQLKKLDNSVLSGCSLFFR